MTISYAKYLDNGHWTVVTSPPDSGEKTFIENVDFTHDVRLYVTGDFATVDQKELYAHAIAEVLNNYNRRP